MLRELTIENVAVIEKAVVGFDAGFNVLTGETGAGKSILIDSINAILGSRTSRDIVRNGADRARIWAVFDGLSAALTARLEEEGYPCDGGELLLYREITVDGKSSGRVNGRPATAQTLRDICEGLITIHGQHDNQSLLNPARHLAVVDAYAKNRNVYKAYHELYRALVSVERQIKSLSMDEREKQAKMELLQYQVDEIEAASLMPGEEGELAVRRGRMQHAQKITDALTQAIAALDGDDEAGGAVDLLSMAAHSMGEAARYDTSLAADGDRLQEAYYAVQEISGTLRAHLDGLAMDAAEQAQLEERLDLFYRLKQKYGATAQEILDHAAAARRELESLTFSQERLDALYEEREALIEQTVAAADALTDSRLAAFAQLQKELSASLSYLNMAGVEFSLRHARGALTSSGQDTLEFYIVTNRGEQPKPLAKIASGGELSRIMLALKNALADSDDIATVIYDEIDTGVSGQAAGRIGRVMQNTSGGGRQIICVTHTPQIAASADNHLLIEKNTDGTRTYTQVHTLQPDQRVEALARMISGDHVTDIARAGAAEMLQSCARGQNA